MSTYRIRGSIGIFIVIILAYIIGFFSFSLHRAFGPFSIKTILIYSLVTLSLASLIVYLILRLFYKSQPKRITFFESSIEIEMFRSVKRVSDIKDVWIRKTKCPPIVYTVVLTTSTEKVLMYFSYKNNNKVEAIIDEFYRIKKSVMNDSIVR